MRRWAEMIGAELYAETHEDWHFWKVADSKALPMTLKELVARYCWKHEITSMMTMSTKNMPHSLRDTRILSSCMVLSENTGRLSRPCS